jgi:hypothetical protein
MYNILNYIDWHMIVSIITSVGIIMMFLGVFYFTYAANVEKEIVQINANIVVEDLLSVISPLLNPATKETQITNLTYPDMADADKKVETDNNNLLKSAYTNLSIVFVITLVLGFIIAYFTKINYYNIIGLNLIILVFVGLTEYTFLNMIVKKFIAADTNYIRLIILENLNKKFNITID